MSKEKNSFDRLMDLFKGLPRLITTEQVVINQSNREGDQLVVPVNDLVLIDASVGSRKIIQHGGIVKYVAISLNQVLFNGVMYKTAFVIQENYETKQRKIFNMLFDSDTLAVHCSDSECPIECVGHDPRFIKDPKECVVVKYVPAKPHSTTEFVRQQFNINVSSKLNYSINNDGITVNVLNDHPNNKVPL